jgi:hypothetical protein
MHFLHRIRSLIGFPTNTHPQFQIEIISWSQAWPGPPCFPASHFRTEQSRLVEPDFWLTFEVVRYFHFRHRRFFSSRLPPRSSGSGPLLRMCFAVFPCLTLMLLSGPLTWAIEYFFGRRSSGLMIELPSFLITSWSSRSFNDHYPDVQWCKYLYTRWQTFDDGNYVRLVSCQISRFGSCSRRFEVETNACEPIQHLTHWSRKVIDDQRTLKNNKITWTIRQISKNQRIGGINSEM